MGKSKGISHRLGLHICIGRVQKSCKKRHGASRIGTPASAGIAMAVQACLIALIRHAHKYCQEEGMNTIKSKHVNRAIANNSIVNESFTGAELKNTIVGNSGTIVKSTADKKVDVQIASS